MLMIDTRGNTNYTWFITNQMEEHPMTTRSLTKAQYNNLLPVMRKHLFHRASPTYDEYSFIGTDEEYDDAMHRCAFL